MNIKRLLKKFYTDPNSPEGLRIRAEVLRENADKDPESQELCNLLAQVYDELADRNLSPTENKKFIYDNLRSHISHEEKTKFNPVTLFAYIFAIFFSFWIIYTIVYPVLTNILQPYNPTKWDYLIMSVIYGVFLIFSSTIIIERY